MRRARADDSFTWEPFDHGRRRRMAALVAVGLCAGLVGLVVGRVSSGGSVGIARAPPPESAVTTKNGQAAFATPTSPSVALTNPATEQQTSSNNSKFPSRTPEPMPLPVHPERQTSPAPVPAVGKQNDHALPPYSPPVVLLNPGSGKQNADDGERALQRQRRGRQHSPALAPKSEKKKDQGVPPAQAARRVVQRPVASSINEEDSEPRRRPQNGGHRSTLTDASSPEKSRVSRSERPATFADYGALRDYMMRR
jgi:hypothetical protein